MKNPRVMSETRESWCSLNEITSKNQETVPVIGSTIPRILIQLLKTIISYVKSGKLEKNKYVGQVAEFYR